MPLTTGIQTQRSAVVLLSNIVFEHNPNNIDQQQQLLEGGTAINATDSSTIYFKDDIVFNLNAETWFDASYGSSITWLSDFNIIATTAISDALVVPFKLYCNSNIDIQAGQGFGLFNNNSNFTDQDLLSQVTIDTSSSLYVNTDIEFHIKQDDNDIKGSLNNVFYSAGEPYVNINLTGNLPTFTNATQSLNIGSNTIDSGDNLLSIGNNNSLGGVNNNDSDISKIVQIGFDNEYSELFFGGSLGNSVQIGVGNENINSSWDLVQIGYNNTTNSSASNSFILGSNCLINNNGSNSIAIGNSAVIDNNVTNSLQIGTGTNSNSDTVQFKSVTIANEFSIQVPVVSGTPTASAADGSLAIDDSAGNEQLCIRVNGAWLCIPFQTTF